MDEKRETTRAVLKNLGGRYLIALLLAMLISAAAISYIGQRLYITTDAELELRGEVDVARSAERFNSYLVFDRNALIIASYEVNRLLVADAPTEDILAYMTQQSERMIHAIDEDFTGLYGWVNGEYLDGSGWVPEADYIPTERPWYIAAAARPREIVFVDPYVDQQTGKVMITIAQLLDDGESVIALDIGLQGVQEITDEITADTPETVVMVLDSGDVVIAHSDLSEVGSDYSAAGNSLGGMIVRTLDENPENHFTVVCDGRTYRVYAKELEGGWHCVSVTNADEFRRPLHRVILLTVALGVIALVLVLVIFYRMSRRELRNRNLNIQIQTAADVYDVLRDINLRDDTYYELRNLGRVEDLDQLHTGAQAVIDAQIQSLVDEGAKLYVKEFSDLSTLNKRLADKDVLSAEFLAVDKKWRRGRIICAERTPEGTATRVLYGVEMIDDEKREQETLRHLAETDLMTGIYNRVSGENKIAELLKTSGGMFVLFDIDRFKQFNDRFGHTVGDQVVIAVANCLRNSFRVEDVVMRLGGDEFAAFAVGVRTRDIGERIMERFCDNLKNVVIPGTDEPICVSAGAAFSRDDGTASFQTLYERADRCMYESKKTADSRTTYEE